MSSITVSDAAREIGGNVTPRDISALFYKRALRDDIAPIVAGRRMIPREYLDVIRMELRRAGKLPPTKREAINVK